MKILRTFVAVCSALMLLGSAGFVTGCKHMDSDNDNEKHAGAHKYTCTHHPEVVQNSPGTCPKCGMTLVHKD